MNTQYVSFRSALNKYEVGCTTLLNWRKCHFFRKNQTIVRRFKASSWNEAMRKHYLFCGLGVYVTSRRPWPLVES